MRPEIQVGSVVMSRAGRDTGRYMLVLALPQENYALVADGRTHKLAKPKLKKLRHLTPRPALCTEIIARLQRGEHVQDANLRTALAELTAADHQPREEE